MLLHLSPALALIQPPLFLQPPCKCPHPHVLSRQLQQGCPLCPQYSQTASYCIPPRFCLTTSLFSDSLPSVSTSVGLLKLFWKLLLPAAFPVGISQLLQRTFSATFSSHSCIDNPQRDSSLPPELLTHAKFRQTGPLTFLGSPLQPPLRARYQR